METGAQEAPTRPSHQLTLRLPFPVAFELRRRLIRRELAVRGYREASTRSTAKPDETDRHWATLSRIDTSEVETSFRLLE